MAAAIFPRRLAALTRLRCEIFQTAYNPTSVRTGAKYLRARLRGPSMLTYYPPEVSIAKLRQGNPDWDVVDFDELERLADVEYKKKRGKGAPKKAKTKGASRDALGFNMCTESLPLSTADSRRAAKKR